MNMEDTFLFFQMQISSAVLMIDASFLKMKGCN